MSSIDAENAKLKKQNEYMELKYSELGIAFDDLKREKLILVEKLVELAEKWRKEVLDYPHNSEGLYCKVAVELCADELEVIIDDKAGDEEASEI